MSPVAFSMVRSACKCGFFAIFKYYFNSIIICFYSFSLNYFIFIKE